MKDNKGWRGRDGRDDKDRDSAKLKDRRNERLADTLGANWEVCGGEKRVDIGSVYLSTHWDILGER